MTLSSKEKEVSNMDGKNYVDSFKKLYPEVIDENGYMKVCGRDKCKELIRLAHFITGGLNTYGDQSTGCVNREKMIELYNVLTR